MSNNLLEKVKQYDFSFIVSLIIIVFVALYFGIDMFNRSNLSEYLEKTGNELFAKIVDQNVRTSLQDNYAEILKKIDNKEISPEKVEQLTANLINLNLSKEYLDPEELRVVFQSTLDKAKIGDSLNAFVETYDDRWHILNERVVSIEHFEDELGKVKLEDRALNGSGVFEYAVDDSLHIIADDRLKSELAVSPTTRANKIVVLELGKNLKWTKDLKDQLTRGRKMIKEKIARLKISKNEKNIASAHSSALSHELSIMSNALDSVIELEFNFNIPPARIDSTIHKAPEIPKTPNTQIN